MSKVLVFGAFDGLHPGHIDFFKQARKFGDYLIVSVGTDKNVKKIKGKRPLFSQEERKDIVSSLKIVDEAILGAEEDFYGHIKTIAPDVICLGYDQWADEEDVKKNLESIGLLGVRVKRLLPYRSEKSKSTYLKEHSVDF
ncbi:MAG: adenylyltransferase/cytidyltransferase family protein [Candidatus Curtissbacteria bacterium]